VLEDVGDNNNNNKLNRERTRALNSTHRVYPGTREPLVKVGGRLVKKVNSLWPTMRETCLLLYDQQSPAGLADEKKIGHRT